MNPSGRSADAFVYDLTSSPAWNNSAPHKYDNMDEFNIPGLLTDTPSTPSFINYVGYPRRTLERHTGHERRHLPALLRQERTGPVRV